MDKSFAKRMLEDLIHWPTEYWDSNDDDIRSTYGKLLMGAKKRVKIVCGECNPELYNEDSIIEALRVLLEVRGVHVDFVFSELKSENPEDNALKRLREDNPKLCELFNKHPDNVCVYLFNRHYNLYYTIVDGKDCFFEEIHEAYRTGKTRARINDKKLGKAWEDRFDEFTSLMLNQRMMTQYNPKEVCVDKAETVQGKESEL